MLERDLIITTIQIVMIFKLLSIHWNVERTTVCSSAWVYH